MLLSLQPILSIGCPVPPSKTNPLTLFYCTNLLIILVYVCLVVHASLSFVPIILISLLLDTKSVFS